MTTGIAAVHARIAAIEQRFAVARPAGRPPEADFGRSLSNAEAAVAAVPERPATATGGPLALFRPHQLSAPPQVRSTEMGAAGPPAELAAYGNGRIPTDALAPIGQGDHRLWSPASAAFRDM